MSNRNGFSWIGMRTPSLRSSPSEGSSSKGPNLRIERVGMEPILRCGSEANERRLNCFHQAYTGSSRTRNQHQYRTNTDTSKTQPIARIAFQAHTLLSLRAVFSRKKQQEATRIVRQANRQVRSQDGASTQRLRGF